MHQVRFIRAPLEMTTPADIMFPERYQRLARQRHDCRLLQTAAIAPDPFFKPQGPRRVRKMAEPSPRELDGALFAIADFLL